MHHHMLNVQLPTIKNNVQKQMIGSNLIQMLAEHRAQSHFKVVHVHDTSSGAGGGGPPVNNGNYNQRLSSTRSPLPTTTTTKKTSLTAPQSNIHRKEDENSDQFELSLIGQLNPVLFSPQ